ncbi:sugar ABC transporter substrate-binding protein [Actinobacteria bacterium YIM 96077]|uniref:Sugar ABC transporter substrate-binding protein n=1 Tax=Phytoactinopolyspora halophila TaxID=1981511 RepID=A0A329QFJ7_9ACTN|nr:substrate-binding domain-containing protein [Phytoactinopolyspora halophila]AYY13943.1 sugar ABC transporter substrate-binding protein [Actinobacteria bacterium YIM 96077]RAW10072.1 sugar ABC transporter substrate-binding protein [Phytoactinopolyspora halophila]
MTRQHGPARRARMAMAGTALGLLVLSACTGDEQRTAEESSDAWCDGMTIRYFAGGSPGDGFAPILANGAEQAGEDIGAQVEVVYSEWEPEQMLGDLRDAIAGDVDGIALTGHPGDDAIMPLAEDAEEEGILMTYQNVDVPEVREQLGGGFVGADLEEQGIALAEEALSTLELDSAARALVMGPFGDQARAVREEAAATTLEDAGLEVDRVTPPMEAFTDPNLLTPTVTGYLQENPDTELIVYPGTVLGSAPQYMDAAGMEAGEILNVGFDLTPATLEAIESGHVQLTADQQPYMQGYLPVLNLCQRQAYGMGPIEVDTGSGFVTEGNVDEVAEPVEQGIR